MDGKSALYEQAQTAYPVPATTRKDHAVARYLDVLSLEEKAAKKGAKAAQDHMHKLNRRIHELTSQIQEAEVTLRNLNMTRDERIQARKDSGRSRDQTYAIEKPDRYDVHVFGIPARTNRRGNIVVANYFVRMYWGNLQRVICETTTQEQATTLAHNICRLIGQSSFNLYEVQSKGAIHTEEGAKVVERYDGN